MNTKAVYGILAAFIVLGGVAAGIGGWMAMGGRFKDDDIWAVTGKSIIDVKPLTENERIRWVKIRNERIGKREKGESFNVFTMSTEEVWFSMSIVDRHPLPEIGTPQIRTAYRVSGVNLDYGVFELSDGNAEHYAVEMANLPSWSCVAIADLYSKADPIIVKYYWHDGKTVVTAKNPTKPRYERILKNYLLALQKV